MRKKLYVVDQGNGYFGGYEKRDEDGSAVMHQFFNSTENLLDFSMKPFLDAGYEAVQMPRDEFLLIPFQKLPDVREVLP